MGPQIEPQIYTYMAHERPMMADNDSTHSSNNDAINEILPENIENCIITKAPEERWKLGTWTVIGLVVNRVIGTGIFNSPSLVIQGTGSVGVTLLFWFAGAVFTIAGAYMFIEFGLSIPRYFLDNQDQAVPRSGGMLNYLQYVYRRPAYRKGSEHHPGTVLMITCIFGAAYIILGNMAGNCLVFGIRVIDAAGLDSDQYETTIRGIAVGVATLACLIHTFSRRGGIWLGNLFALIKVGLLTMMVIVGFCAWGGVFKVKTSVSHNMAAQNAFRGAETEPYGYVRAFLSVVFAYTGFDQPNYVLGEISTPRKTFPKGESIGVAIICVLYLLVNVAYMIVVPKELQLTTGTNVASEFFRETLATVNGGNGNSTRILSAFMAISSFGNIMVMTFVAARVKQAIALEGVIPFAKFFGRNTNLSFGRFLKRIQRDDRSFASRHMSWLLSQRWMSATEHTQETPFGALALHWLFTMVMIVATIRLKPSDAYTLLVNLYSYTVVCIFGFVLSFGMLKLRLTRSGWRKKSWSNTPFLSIMAASVFFVASGYPIFASLVPPSGERSIKLITGSTAWYVTPVVAGAILLFGLIWYLTFIAWASYRWNKERLEFRVQKVPEFDRDVGADDQPVQVHETVYIAWVAKEARAMVGEVGSRNSRESF